MTTNAYHALAPINSMLNAVAAILLCAGFYCIRRRWIRAHRAFMISAFIVSTIFFISYCTYHYEVGDVHFQGYGPIRPVYFSILITHVALAAAIVPLAVLTLARALRGNFAKHRRIARLTWPIWLYVSITGVAVYLLCYQLYPPGYSARAELVPAPIAANLR
jgi:uncharacterized membrane protein YozB (DUF420 family)